MVQLRGSSAYYILLCGALIWCSLIFLPPLAAAAHVGGSQMGYKLFSHICHQDPDRSLFLAGHPLGVCARCTAIYLGFLLGVLLSPALARRIRLSARWCWTIAVLPMVLDVVTPLFGFHTITLGSRLTTGLFFGICSALILTPLLECGLSDLISIFRNKERISHASQT